MTTSLIPARTIQYNGHTIPFVPTARIAIPFWLMKAKGLHGAELDVMVLEDHPERNYRILAAVVVIRESQWCLNCGLEITNPVSQMVGYGPICSAWLGIVRPDLSPDAMDAWRKEHSFATLTTIQLPIKFKNGPNAGKDIARILSGHLTAANWPVASNNGPPRPAGSPAAPPSPPPPPPPPRIQAKVIKDRIAVSFPRYHAELHAFMKQAPGARWGGTANPVWSVPSSPRSAKQIKDAFPDVDGDAAFLDLLANGIVSAESDALKGASMDSLIADLHNWKLPPWRHQAVAIQFAKANHAVGLFLDVGTGKTKVTIDVLVELHLPRVLVICPVKVIPTWAKEAHKHTFSEEEAVAWNAAHPDDPRRETAFTVVPLTKGSVAKRMQVAKDAVRYAGNRSLMIVLNYEAAWRDEMAEFLLSQEWDLVVLDEAHKIKTPGTKVSLFCASLAKHATRRMALTATPLPQSPLDAYSLYRFLDPAVFGTSFAKFRAHYAEMGGYGGYEILEWKNTDELHHKMYDGIAYRVTAKDVLDLPPVQHIQIDVELEPAARAAYNRLVKDYVAWVEGEQIDVDTVADFDPDALAVPDAEEVLQSAQTNLKRGQVVGLHVLQRMTRMLQMCSGIAVAQVDGKETTIAFSYEKRDTLRELLSDMRWHAPLVVFVDYHIDMDNVRWVCAQDDVNRPVFEISGRTAMCRPRRDVMTLWPDQYRQWQAEVKQGITADNQYGQWQTIAAWYRDHQAENEEAAEIGIRPINPATGQPWPPAPVVIVQIAAGGVGVDLSMANIGIYYNNGFSLGNHLQSLGRLHRPGTVAKAVRFYHLVTVNSIDQTIYDALLTRQNVVQQVLKDVQTSAILPRQAS